MDWIDETILKMKRYRITQAEIAEKYGCRRENINLILNRRSLPKGSKEKILKAIEEIITINELQAWTEELNDSDVDGIIRDIDIYYKLEMNLEAEDEE